MNAVLMVCQGIAAFGALCCVLRIVLGPSLADRVLALDTLLVTIVVLVALRAARTDEGRYLDLLLVVALVAFIGTVSVGRFIERRGAR